MRKWTCCTSTWESEKLLTEREHMKRKLMGAVVAGAFALAGPAVIAQQKISDGVVKIGVLTDMSGLYSDLGGQGSVVAAQMAIDDFGKTVLGAKIELVSADHQNNAETG